MTYRAVVAAILLSSPAAFAADCPRHPTSAFQALPQGERNLAVYDAFWANLEKNHYDPQMLSRAEVRALRERGRSMAAAAGHPAGLYGQVFSSITSELPDARLKVKLPPSADSTIARRRFSKSPEEAQRLAESLYGEGGIDQATSHRGSKNDRVIPIERRNVDDVRYVRFDDFGDDEFMKPVYQALREAGPDGLIIDLRWNGGGQLRQAQKLAGVLLGDVVMGIQQDARGIERIRTLRPVHRYQGPLAILIGPGSSSASEILAAAIKDHRRGKLIGRVTNGSLLDSAVFPLPDGGFVTVPTRDFRSANNRQLDGVGVAPDVRVLPTPEDVRAGRDTTLERAVQVIRASAGANRPTPGFRHRRDELFPPI